MEKAHCWSYALSKSSARLYAVQPEAALAARGQRATCRYPGLPSELQLDLRPGWQAANGVTADRSPRHARIAALACCRAAHQSGFLRRSSPALATPLSVPPSL